MKGDNYYKNGARNLVTGGSIFTSKSGRAAYTPGFLRGREMPTDFKKLRNRVFLVAAIVYFALCLHGVYMEVTIGRV